MGGGEGGGRADQGEGGREGERKPPRFKVHFWNSGSFRYIMLYSHILTHSLTRSLYLSWLVRFLQTDD